MQVLHPLQRIQGQRNVGLWILLVAVWSLWYVNVGTHLILPTADYDYSEMTRPLAMNQTIISSRPKSSIRTWNTMDTDLENCTNTTVRVASSTFVPIFVITRDRLSSLQTAIQSYQRTLTSPYEIIILDHNSTYPPMVNYLHELQTKQGITVHPLQSEWWRRAKKEADDFIQNYLERHPSIEFYVFTDPDIAFLRTSPDILLFLAGLLKSCPDVDAVGPHLQISDLPAHYQRKFRSTYTAFEWESRFWTTVPNMATWNGLGYHISRQAIDTTFAMRRRNEHIRPLSGRTLRSYAPFAAVHVDWYHDSQNLPADKVWYMRRQQGAGNW